jgi:hypothetical protein
VIFQNYYKATFTCGVRPCATTRGVVVLFLCAFEMVGILVFFSVASPQLQESQLWEGGGRIIIEVFNGSISCLVFVHPAPSGAEDQ